jgi:hypothetical protein
MGCGGDHQGLANEIPCIIERAGVGCEHCRLLWSTEVPMGARYFSDDRGTPRRTLAVVCFGIPGPEVNSVNRQFLDT